MKPMPQDSLAGATLALCAACRLRSVEITLSITNKITSWVESLICASLQCSCIPCAGLGDHSRSRKEPARGRTSGGVHFESLSESS